MANKVSNTPNIPSPAFLQSQTSVSDYITSLVQRLVEEFRAHALRLNASIPADGSEVPTAPVMLKSYPKAGLPDALKFMDGLIIVTDDVGGLTTAFSDGTNWRRTADRNVIS